MNKEQNLTMKEAGAVRGKMTVCRAYYPYKLRGLHDHAHSFPDVLAAAVRSGGRLEPEEAERWYAPWMLEHLRRVQEDRELRCRLVPWACKLGVSDKLLERCGLGQPEIPCTAGGQQVRCREIDDVCGLADRFPYDFRLEEPVLCSEEQRSCIEAVRQHRMTALAEKAN